MHKECSIIINARTQSSRLPNKVVHSFADSTLFEISIQKMIQIKSEHRYVSIYDGDDVLMGIYEKYKHQVGLISRSFDSVSTGKKHQRVTFAHYLKVPTKYIMVINPCAPLIKINTYQQSLRQFLSSDFNTLTSVIEKNNIFFNSSREVINSSSYDVSTQNNEIVYEMAHSFHIFDKDFFADKGYFWDYTKNNPYLFVVSSEEAYDIDYQLDFDICEYLYKKVFIQKEDVLH